MRRRTHWLAGAVFWALAYGAAVLISARETDAALDVNPRGRENAIVGALAGAVGAAIGGGAGMAMGALLGAAGGVCRDLKDKLGKDEDSYRRGPKARGRGVA